MKFKLVILSTLVLFISVKTLNASEITVNEGINIAFKVRGFFNTYLELSITNLKNKPIYIANAGLDNRIEKVSSSTIHVFAPTIPDYANIEMYSFSCPETIMIDSGKEKKFKIYYPKTQVGIKMKNLKKIKYTIVFLHSDLKYATTLNDASFYEFLYKKEMYFVEGCWYL